MAEALRPNFNAAKPRLRRFRLTLSNRDPITRPQPLAQIAVASALADLIFDDAQDAPQQEMRGVDPRGPTRHRLAASPELGDRVAFGPQQAQPISIAVRASCGVFLRHGCRAICPLALIWPTRRAAFLFRRHTWRVRLRCRCRRSSPRGSSRPG